MSLENKDGLKSAVEEYITKGVEKEVEKGFEKLKDEFFADLNRRKNQIVTGIVLDIMKQVDITQANDRTVITIREIVKQQ